VLAALQGPFFPSIVPEKAQSSIRYQGMTKSALTVSDGSDPLSRMRHKNPKFQYTNYKQYQNYKFE